MILGSLIARVGKQIVQSFGRRVWRLPDKRPRGWRAERTRRRAKASGDPDPGPGPQIGRAHVCTPVTNAPLVCRLLLEQNNNTHYSVLPHTYTYNRNTTHT